MKSIIKKISFFVEKINLIYSDIQKNGSSIVIYDHNLQSNPGNGLSVQGNRIIDMNGSTDYLEFFVLMNTDNSTQRIFGGSTGTTFFGAYRIGA